MPKIQSRIITGNEIVDHVCKHAAGVQSIVLCSPFLTTAGIKPLLSQFKKKDKVNLDVISRFDELEWITGVTEPEVFEELFRLSASNQKKWNINIWLVDSLHSKVILIGNKVAIIGSANITGGGFEGNHELGILISGSKVETLKKRIEGYKEAGVPLTPESFAAKKARLEGEEGRRIKSLIADAKRKFLDRRCPGIIEFTRERQGSLDYSQHVFQVLEFIGARKIKTDTLKTWLDKKALIADEPKASTRRIYFLESLGLIEEIKPNIWMGTPRGKEVLHNGKPALYRRMKSRWKTFATLEDVLKRKFKSKVFNAAVIAKEEEFKKADSKKIAVIDRLNHHLRWLRSLNVIEAVTVKGTKGRFYQLSPASA
jgi:HKD family nuclease